MTRNVATPIGIVALLLLSACAPLVSLSDRPCPCDVNSVYSVCCAGTCVAPNECNDPGKDLPPTPDAAGPSNPDGQDTHEGGGTESGGGAPGGVDGSGKGDAMDERATMASDAPSDEGGADLDASPGTGDEASDSSDSSAYGDVVTPDGDDSSADDGEGCAPPPADASVATTWEPPHKECAYLTTIARGYGIGCQQSMGWTGFIVVGYSDGELFQAPNGTDPHPNWLPISGPPLPATAITAIAINPCNDQEVFVSVAGTTQGADLYSIESLQPLGTLTWTESTTFPLHETWGLSYHPSGSIIYAVGSGGQVVASPDDGVSWSASPPVGGIAIPSADAGLAVVTSVDFFDSDPNTMIVGTTSGHLWLTFDGMTWIDTTSPGMPSRPVTHVVADPQEIQMPFFFATYVDEAPDSVWISENGGGYWLNSTNADLPTDKNSSSYGFFGVNYNPADPLMQTLYINGSSGVGVSSDNGLSWQWQQVQ